MAGPITLLTELWQLESLRHTHNFLYGEQDTRTTFKAAEPKWGGHRGEALLMAWSP